MFQNVDIEVQDLINRKRVPRAKTKKELKEQLALYGPDAFYLESVSPMGPQYNGTLDKAPTTTTFTLEGPDPYGVHKWYANIVHTPKGWVVK